MNQKIARIKNKIKRPSDIMVGTIIGAATTAIAGYVITNKVLKVPGMGCKVLTEILDDFADGEKHLAWLDGGTFYVQPEPHNED